MSGGPDRIAERLFRGRAAGAAIWGAVAVASAIELLPWSPGRLLSVALALAFLTLLLAGWFRHASPSNARERIAALVFSVACDTALLVGVAASSGKPELSWFAGASVTASVAWHAWLLARIAHVDEESSVVSARSMTRLREALGIARARAESLHLLAEESGRPELLRHDLEVLIRQIDECQHALRPAAPTAARLADFSGRTRRSAARTWLNESTPPRS